MIALLIAKKKIAQIKADFPNVTAVEMEATAIAQVCHAFNVPFVVVRAISDAGDGEASMSFEEFLPLAAKQSSAFSIGHDRKIIRGNVWV